MILSFILFWPAGLVVLGFLLGSGRMGCWIIIRASWRRPLAAQMDRMQRGFDRMQEGMTRAGRGRALGRCSSRPATGLAGPSSGNRAFDEYRAETLRRLEEEQREFMEFLDRLRHAKDKAEFDQFMAERRGMRDVTPNPQQ